MKLIPGEWRYYDETLNMPYPWYTKPCLEFLETLDLKGKRVFEYGVGDSTFWWREKGAEVFGVDNDEKWAVKTKTHLAKSGSDYIKYIDTYDFIFDIVVVDGIMRDLCVNRAFGKLKKGGLLIIDNYDQPSVRETWYYTKRFVKKSKLKFSLYRQHGHEDWQTAILVKESEDFKGVF